MGTSQYWWAEEEKDRHKAITETVTHLTTNQNYRQEAFVRYLRLYSNMEQLGLIGSRYATKVTPAIEGRLKLNIVHSCCDTITNKIAKNKPKPTFLTDDGDWSEQQKAKKLDKFVEGMFYDMEAYRFGPVIHTDATVFGTGFLKIYIDQADKRIKCERVFPDEILVDDAECFYGKPRQLFQRKFINRDVLAQLMPKHKTAIYSAARVNDFSTNYKRLVDQVLVWEAWHLPSTKDADDGRHSIVIDGATLFDEEYEIECFPFSMLKWSDRLVGFWGEGLAEQLMGLQLEINKLLRTIQVAMHLCSVPHWMIEQGSKVVKSHINNEIGGFITWSGTMPVLQAVNAVPPELREHLLTLINQAYQIAGISQLSAQAKKPSGLDSGKALREFNDIESERYILAGMRYEDLFMDLAKIGIKLVKQQAEVEGDYEVRLKNKRGNVEKIKWSEVDLDEDKYVMQMFPTSFLPQTPQGRLQSIQELIEVGYIGPEDGFDLLDFPDLKAHTSLQTAAVQDIKRVIEVMIEDGKYVPPEPFQNLSYGLQRIQSAYLRAKNEGVPEGRLELLRRWMNQAMQLMAKAMPPAPSLPAPSQPVMGEPTPIPPTASPGPTQIQ